MSRVWGSGVGATAHLGEVEGGDGAAQAVHIDLEQAQQHQHGQGQAAVYVLLLRHAPGLRQADWRPTVALSSSRGREHPGQGA